MTNTFCRGVVAATGRPRARGSELEVSPEVLLLAVGQHPDVAKHAASYNRIASFGPSDDPKRHKRPSGRTPFARNDTMVEAIRVVGICREFHGVQRCFPY